MKKIALTMGAAVILATPIATVISCGENSQSKKSGDNHNVPLRRDTNIEDKENLQWAFDLLTTKTPYYLMRRKPSSMKGITPENIALKVFAIKKTQLQLKNVTFSDIKTTNPDDENGTLNIEFNMHLNNEVKHFKRKLQGNFFMDKEEAEYNYLRGLEEFRFRTSITNQRPDGTLYKEWEPEFNDPKETSDPSLRFTEEQWNKVPISFDTFEWENIAKENFFNDPRTKDTNDKIWLSQYKTILGFDIHDNNKSFKGKTYAEWFKGIELIGIEQQPYDGKRVHLGKEDNIQNYDGKNDDIWLNHNGGEGDTWRFSFPVEMNEKGEHVYSKIKTNVFGGAKFLKLKLRKGTHEFTIRTYLEGWFYSTRYFGWDQHYHL